MNCQPCKVQDHLHCIDMAPEGAKHVSRTMNINGKDYPVVPGRLYRSCFCHHQDTVKAEPATGPAGE